MRSKDTLGGEGTHYEGHLRSIGNLGGGRSHLQEHGHFRGTGSHQVEQGHTRRSKNPLEGTGIPQKEQAPLRRNKNPLEGQTRFFGNSKKIKDTSGGAGTPQDDQGHLRRIKVRLGRASIHYVCAARTTQQGERGGMKNVYEEQGNRKKSKDILKTARISYQEQDK